MTNNDERDALSDESEQVKLLGEIRDLMTIVADSYRDAYEQRQADREEKRMEGIRTLVNSSPKRRKAWDLVNGMTSQRDISKRSGLDEGTTSRYFKALRELRAIEGDIPKRIVSM